MYFGATCGTRRRRSAERNSEWKSSQWAACSKYGFMPGNGDGMVHLLGALSNDEPCPFLPTSARFEDSMTGAAFNTGARPMPLQICDIFPAALPLPCVLHTSNSVRHGSSAPRPQERREQIIADR